MKRSVLKCLKIVIFQFRVLANYVYHEGAVTAISDIIQHAEEDKENQSGNCDCSLGFSSLGRIVRDLWEDKVKNAKRGARAHRRHVYLNLKRILPCEESDENHSLSLELSKIHLPENWTRVEDNANTVSFVRLEKWSFDNQRVSTAVAVSQTDNNTFITIRSHGCETEVPTDVVLGSMQLAKQIGAVFRHIDNSLFCGGFCLSEGESFLALADCVKGSYKDLSAELVEKQQVVYFSSSYKTFSSHDGRCSECKNLKYHNLKRQRKEKRASIHPHCNRRYLTREELNVQLQNQRTARLNAERRERYWKGKFDSEAVELEDDDHKDLSQMLTNVPKEKVPEEMLCMWEQQKKKCSQQKANTDTDGTQSKYTGNSYN